ncbi:MAG: energy transducer TonB [Deltaproteobacteria bacterium]|nr:energy transducer TonB [Deltaproteobacteria bacterium]
MNRYLTLSAILHGVLFGGLAIWGASMLDSAAPEITRVRIIDERGGAAAAGAPDRTDTPPAAPLPEPRAEIPTPPPSRSPATTRAATPPTVALPREQEALLAAAAPAPAGAGGSLAVASLPAGAAAAERDGAGAERDDRIAEIHARIQAALLYPREARRRGVEGTVHLRFALAEDGRVRRVDVRESSGARLLDRASIETVRRAQPFPFVAGDLEVPVVFRLTGAQ